jgi:hypothetical protein
MRALRVIRSAATIAIVRTRLRLELRTLALAASACGLLAYLQRFDDAAAQLVGSLLFGTLTGIAVALLQRGAGRARELELCEQAAPLYGRELARATALVPCIVVSAALAAYWLITSAYAELSAGSVSLTVLASCAAAVTAMSATVRVGLPRVLYIAIACAISALAFALTRLPIAIALAFCVASGFVALRQYGEALARYDPV